ncbi:unnamed protein product [Bursaphelenchus xylophilus]|uniref:(pine wood nematode) hypothetical protein n=1 Tax=Bursaphelenchus xylophilus TaxID=6326 RepID=A0A7I8X973_BURXY|nr:unnamed protein product [Bursaphelenchus xylophilus]CAG9131965.1 unnamed protein product [Bursaphelenchus xylophilus]
MGGWKLEAGRFMILVGFPVAAFWAFDQTGVFSFFMKGYQIPYNEESEERARKWKEELGEQRRREQYEKLLREQMAFEESRKLREQHGI